MDIISLGDIGQFSLLDNFNSVVKNKVGELSSNVHTTHKNYEVYKTYLELKHPKNSLALMQHLHSHGLANVSRSRVIKDLIGNWQQKRLVRDLDLINTSLGSIKRVVVDRKIPPSRTCNQVIKGLILSGSFKPKPDYAMINNELNVQFPIIKLTEAESLRIQEEILKDKGIKPDNHWSRRTFDYCEDSYDREFNKRSRETLVEKEEEFLDKHEVKLDIAARKLEKSIRMGGLMVNKNYPDYSTKINSYKEALLKNSDIPPVVARPVFQQKKEGSIKNLIARQAAFLKKDIIKNLSISSNIQGTGAGFSDWKSHKLVGREDMRFNDNLIAVQNYYSCLSAISIYDDGHDLLDEVVLSVFEASCAVDKSQKRLLRSDGNMHPKVESKAKSTAKSKLSGNKSRKKPKASVVAAVKRNESLALERTCEIKSSKKRVGRVVKATMKLCFSSDVKISEDRFTSFVIENDVKLSKKLNVFRNLQVGLREMHKVAISKIWSRTDTYDLEKAIVKHKAYVNKRKEKINKLTESLLRGFRIGYENVDLAFKFLNNPEKEESFRLRKEADRRKQEKINEINGRRLEKQVRKEEAAAQAKGEKRRYREIMKLYQDRNSDSD